MTPTWHVYSVMPPECHEVVSCTSMLDAAKAWADRQFRHGMVPRSGTEVIVYCENDINPRLSAYRVKITLVNAPAFRATLAGLAFEGLNGSPANGGGRG
jgi:hypothetical protein